MLERLDGMFAIVIVDLSTREIHAARDHMGIKPFYWAQQGDTLLFASEVKSFLAHAAFSALLHLRVFVHQQAGGGIGRRGSNGRKGTCGPKKRMLPTSWSDCGRGTAGWRPTPRLPCR